MNVDRDEAVSPDAEDRLIRALRRRPNLPAVTETSLPLIATVLMGFGVALVGIGAGKDFPTDKWFIETRELASILLGAGSVVFLLCVLLSIWAQSHNYFALNEHAMRYLRIRDEDLDANTILSRYLRPWADFHFYAVMAYYMGLASLLIGSGILFWPFSPVIGIIFWVTAAITIIIMLLQALGRLSARGASGQGSQGAPSSPSSQSPVDTRPAQAHDRGMKSAAAGALVPALGATVSTWFIFNDKVSFAVSSGTVLFFLLILLGPADRSR